MLQSLLTPLLQPLLRPPLEVSGGSGLALYLDFLTEYIDPRITYSGGANGTRVNSAGLIVAATTPRFDYNPVTLAPLGLLVEEARTNLILQSRDLNTSPWLRGATLASLFTVTTDALLGPDGVGGVAKFVTGAVTEQGLFARELLTIPAATYAVTAYIYVPVQSGVTSWSLVVDLSDSVDLGQSATYTTFGQWVRASLSLTATVPRTFVDFNIRRNGVAPTNGDGFTFYVCCADLEAGSFPTSYIPTTSASVTRSADSAVMTGTNFSDWFNPAEGTFAPEFTYGGDLVTSTAMSANDNTSNNILEVAGTNSGGVGPYAEVRVGGVVQASMSDGNAIANTTYKTAFRYRANDFSFSHSGRSCVTDAAGTIPSVSQLAIGNRLASSSFNGWIRRLPYYRRGLSDAQLQALSA